MKHLQKVPASAKLIAIYDEATHAHHTHTGQKSAAQKQLCIQIGAQPIMQASGVSKTENSHTK